MFLLHHKKNASNHLFSKQLKNLQSNQLIVGFNSIIYSSFASDSSTGGAEVPEAARPERAEVPEAARPERAKAQKQHALKGPKAQKQHALFCPTRPERAEAPSPGQRPG